MTRPTRFAYTVCFCAAFFFMGTGTAFLAPLVTRITGNLNITLSVFSGILILRPLMFSAGSFLLGRLRRLISANKMVALGLLFLPVVSFIYPRTHSVPVFAAALLLWGIVMGLIEVGADIRNGELPEEFAGQLNFLQYAAISAGAMAGPFLVRSAMRREADLTNLPVFTLLPCLLAAVLIWFLPDVQNGKERELTGNGSDQLSGIVILAGCLMFFACGIDSALNNWSPTAVFREGITDEANAALMPMFFAVGALLSRLLSSVLIRTLKAETIFTFSVSAVCAGALGMLLTRNYAVMLGAQFLFGFGNGAVFSSLLLLLRKRGISGGGQIGFIIGMKSIGDMFISWLTGVVLDHAGAAGCFGVLAAGALLSFALHFWLLRKPPSES